MLARTQVRAPAARSTGQSTRRSVAPRSRSSVTVKALFGWGKKKEEEDDYRVYDKNEMYAEQQRILAERRAGSNNAIKQASERRAAAKRVIEDKKEARRQERQALAEGRMPDSLKNWKPYDDETNKNANSGIVVPLLPFGIKKYDDGERFDLRSPYSDDGWVDPEETDMWAGLKRIGEKILFFGGKNTLIEPQQGKPIVWASQYAKYEAEKKAAKKQQGKK